MTENTILVVDDSAFDRQLLAKTLSLKLNCTVVQAASSDEALKALSAQKIGLVLMDVEMPGTSGEQLVETIRRDPAHEGVPIIMVSGKSGDDVVIRCLKAGANDYITKPINVEVAMTRISCQLKLTEAIGERARHREMTALYAMMVTYNHEINSPLAAAVISCELVKNDPTNVRAIERIETALNQITDIMAKIRAAANKSEADLVTYVGQTKMLKIK